ncbi:MAG: Membrane alanine aminopeptidase N [Rhodanobacteraceae bacterium]|jgi:alanyl aminopeptidase|nr:MAG: Membrane alanine aminopeptidase N [Rhodanobacteraceae bacterium]
MRVFPVFVMAGLLAFAGVALAKPPHAAAKHAAVAAKSAEAPPMTRLPDWAVPQSYELSIKSDPGQPGYSGTVTIAVDLKRASNHVWLHGKDLKVSSVTITDAHGKVHTGKYDGAVTQEAEQAGVARVDFGATLPPQKLRLKFDFTAPYNKTLQGYYKVVFAGNAYAMTQMEPISARLAFPCFDEPGFKAPLDLSLTIPDADKAVANAAEASDKPAGKGWKTVTFRQTRPLPTYLYAWAVGPWDIVNGPTIPPNPWRSTPVPVRGIATRGNGAKMQRALAMVPGIIEHEEAYYGFGYPFGKLDLAALPDFSAGAMENAGLVTFRDWLLLLDKDSAPSAVRSSFNVIAHELAHQWTGDTVTLDWWNDIWLNEAFATWMQQKVEGEIHPDWHAHLDRIEGGQGAMRNDSLVSARMIRQPITGNGDIETAFDGITYQKGAAVIGMFENFVGPKVFQKGMQAYIKAHAFGNANADDLVDAIATAAGKGETFKKAFKSFLDQNGVPLVATKLDCGAKGGAVLELTQSRYLPLGSTGDPNRLWGIPVCVRFPNGVQCQMFDQKSSDMKVDGGQCPAWYMPNADGDGYYRYEMAKADRAALAKVIAQRNDGEQFAYADSITAGFRRGDLDAGEVLAAMRELAPSKVRLIALAPLDTVKWIYDHEARTDAQKTAVRDAVTKAYLPRMEALGYQRRTGESADDVLMRSDLAMSLGLDFKVPQVRAALLKQGEAALKIGKDGLPDLMAANPDLLRTALSVAVEDQGKPAVDELIAAIPKTTDPVKRNAMLGALSHAQGAEADVVRDFALSPQVKVGEMGMLLRDNRDTRAERDGLWNWFTAHYPQIVARTGVFSGGYLPMIAAGGGCSDAEAARVEDYFKPKLGQVPGVKRGLAQTHESIVLCSALKAHQNPASITQ